MTEPPRHDAAPAAPDHALVRRLIADHEDERLRVARELHDHVGQSVTAIKMAAMSLQSDTDPALRDDILADIVATASETIARLRDLSGRLRPPQLESLGLEAALRWQLAQTFEHRHEAVALQVRSAGNASSPAQALACFRIAQAALANVVAHANARQVRVSIDDDAGQLRLEISDDGDGFDPSTAVGHGLALMRERAWLADGSLVIDAAPGGGTRVIAVLGSRR